MRTFLCIGLLIPLSISSGGLFGQAASLVLDTSSVAAGLRIPWDLEWAGPEHILFTERGGRIARLELNSGALITLCQLSDVAEEEHSGLMGMDLHPSWPDSPYVYVVHSYYDPGFSIFMRVLRLDYDAARDTLIRGDTLLNALPGKGTTTGARILIGPDSLLYLSMGDLDQGQLAQDTSSLSGKVLRLNLDGSIPADNPFSGSPVWTMGHRNPQGLSLGPQGQLYSLEHGTFNHDELNRLEPGRNYGWPLLSGPCDQTNQATCDAFNLLAPLFSWTPPLAPCGLAYYPQLSPAPFPEWEGGMLVAGLRDESLTWVQLDSLGEQALNAHTYLKGKVGRIREVLVSPEGRVFVATSNLDPAGMPLLGDDHIYELKRGEGQIDDTTSGPQPLVLDSTQVEIRIVADHRYIPWDLVWAPNGWIWFTERNGRINRLQPETGEIQELIQIEEVFESKDNSGMYSLALHPDFPFLPYVYVHYTYELFHARLVRYTYDPHSQQLRDSIHLIPKMDAQESHNGSRLLFTPDKKLLFAVGDVYRANWSQDIYRLTGKILRMNPDGSVPDDNPFPGSLAYSYGHRNPQGLVRLPNGLLYSSEHGAGGDDELNLIQPSRNYGWPHVHGYCNWPSELAYCDSVEIVEPMLTWSPAHAPCGLAYYDHPAIPEWRNSLLQVFLKAGDGARGQRMEVIGLNAAGDSLMETRSYFENTYGRLRDVLVTPDGRVFICTSNREKNGDMVRQDDDDKIIEIRNPNFPILTPPPPPGLPEEVKIFPNPAQDDVFINLPVADGNMQLRLFNPAGQLLREESVMLRDFVYILGRQGLPKGIYALQLRLPDGQTYVRKVLFD